MRYDYELRVRDPAGNARAHKVTGSPGCSAAGRRVRAGHPVPSPFQRTRPASLQRPAACSTKATRRSCGGHAPKRASYYNVQLFRGGRKILSAWPTRARYQLKLRWTFRAHASASVPAAIAGSVWPGHGPRSKADYGKRIVSTTFKVRRTGTARSSS